MPAQPDYAGALQSVQLPLPGRTSNLALVFQEMLTVIVRLRSGRQIVADAETFRVGTLKALKRAEQEAHTLGYSVEDIRLACFAVVAFLDESVLNSRDPVFGDWARKPLQVEIFGVGDAGEILFQGLEKLLSQKDSRHLADLLEVFYLCLLLGYRGRYSLSSSEGVRPIMDSVAEKIRRIRGDSPTLSRAWLRSDEAARLQQDRPWPRRLFYSAVACFLLTLTLFLGLKVSSNQRLSDLHAIVAQIGE